MALLGGILVTAMGARRSTSTTCSSMPSAWLAGVRQRALDDRARFVLVGLAVGADIPASWSLIAENAPASVAGSTAAPPRCSGISAR
jgi:inositol transporter-like SP family MFS transporter